MTRTQHEQFPVKTVQLFYFAVLSTYWLWRRVSARVLDIHPSYSTWYCTNSRSPASHVLENQPCVSHLVSPTHRHLRAYKTMFNVFWKLNETRSLVRVSNLAFNYQFEPVQRFNVIKQKYFKQTLIRAQELRWNSWKLACLKCSSSRL